MKQLSLTMETREFTNSANGEKRNYDVFVVNLNGLKLPLKPADNTSKMLLTNYFKES